jgi:hypothetical protein
MSSAKQKKKQKSQIGYLSHPGSFLTPSGPAAAGRPAPHFVTALCLPFVFSSDSLKYTIQHP